MGGANKPHNGTGACSGSASKTPNGSGAGTGGDAETTEGAANEAANEAADIQVGGGPLNEVGTGYKFGSSHSKQRSSSSGRSAGRRRALIQTYNEDEEGIDLPPNQPASFKEKTVPYHDADIDTQLDNVTSEHGGSSLHISTSNDEYLVIPRQAAMSLDQMDAINLNEATPPFNLHKSPRQDPLKDTQNAKRRRSEGGIHALNCDASKFSTARTKEAIPSIDMVTHMWLGFSIHEAIATQKGKGIIQENRTNEEFLKLRIPINEVIEFKTTKRASPRVSQLFYPNERPDAVLSNHLHFTQIPRQEKVDPATGLSEGFHITIRFDYGFKSMSKHEAKGACVERLRQMDIPLGLTYSNPIDIGTNTVTKH